MTAASDTPHHKERFDELDGVRAISILCVLAAHLLPLGTGAWVFNDAVALAGMSLFFCLSGFLITYFLWQNQDIRAFLIRRCARIVPLILLFSFILCILVWQRPDSFLIINLYVLNYVDWAFVPGVTPLWSVALEMQFYLVIALAVGVFGRRGFWVVPVIALAVMIFRIEGGAFSAIRTHLRVDEIMSGCLLALLWLNKDQARFQPLIALLRRGFWVFLILWALSTYRDLGAIGYVRPYAAAGLVGAVLFMEERLATPLPAQPGLQIHRCGLVCALRLAQRLPHRVVCRRGQGRALPDQASHHDCTELCGGACLDLLFREILHRQGANTDGKTAGGQRTARDGLNRAAETRHAEDRFMWWRHLRQSHTSRRNVENGGREPCLLPFFDAAKVWFEEGGCVWRLCV